MDRNNMGVFVAAFRIPARVLVLSLVTAFLAPAALAQSVLHFPRVISSGGVFSGLAISNPTPIPATLTLTALRPDGRLLAAQGIANPVSLSIPAGGQYTRSFAEIFGSGVQFNGWVEATSEVSGLTGSFLNGNVALNDLDGTAVVPPTPRFLLPFAADDGVVATELTLVNPLPGPATATVTLFGADGTILGSTVVTVPSRGLIRQTLATIFDSIDRSNGSHVQVTADRPLAGLEVVADFQVPEAPTHRRESIALVGQPIDGSPSSLLSQFAAGQGWISHLGVVNTAGIGQEVTLTAFKSDGTLWDGGTNPARIPLEANEALRISVGELFGFPATELRTGWIEVEAALGHVATFIGLGNAATSSFTLVSGNDVRRASRRLAFAHFADGTTFFTGLTVNNAGRVDATTDLFVLRTDGSTLGRSTLTIPARQTVSTLFRSLVPASFDQSPVWAFLSSTEPVIATALMGTTTGTSLAAVNPQTTGEFIPRAQSTAAITGRVTQGGLGAPGVAVGLTGPVNTRTTTDPAGRFSFLLLPAGTYTLTPSAPGARFVPERRKIELGSTNVDNVSFESGGVVPADLPKLSFVTPSAIFATGSTLNLRFGGSNFSPTSVVQLNGVPLTTTFVSSVELQAVLPAEIASQPAVLTVSIETPPPGGGTSEALEFHVNRELDDPLILV